MWLLFSTAFALDPCDWEPGLLDTPLASATDAQWATGTVMVVRKSARRIQLFDRGEPLKLDDGGAACWQVALGYDYPPGDKQVMGDRKTPEGWFRTSDRPWSMYYGAITVHYPEVRDAARGLRDGLITQAEHDSIVRAHQRDVLPPMETRLGGQILVHGQGSGSDWTLGCVALESDQLDVLRARLPKDMRTHILILP